jgi:hypothetical protein
MSREVSLPSGALLKVNAAPFPEANNLYKAILKEAQERDLNTLNFAKQVYCIAYSSVFVEASLWKCLERCFYNNGVDLKITLSTFEPESARQDYAVVVAEVIRENVEPFFRNLSAVSSILSEITGKVQKSE